MTDLSELLDSRMDDRIMHAINDLDFDGFKTLISELLGGIGVKVTRVDVSEDAAFFEGISEEGKYFVVASRLFDNASVESMKVIKEMATKKNAIPVLMVTCDLDDEERKFAEEQGISYADKPKLLLLLRKYDLAGKMMAEVDRRILDQDKNRYLPSGAQFDSFYNAAEEHLKQGRYRDALYNYDRALDIKPNNDVVWLRKANLFLTMGRFNDALVACKRASELRPGDATAWYLMGLAYNQLGDFEKELKAYDTALKIQPRMEAALLNKGATLFQLHRYDWALAVYEDMCYYFPKDSTAFNNRGIVLKAMGRNKEALESFDRASFLNRNYIDPVVNRALTLKGMGRNEEAIEAWAEALQIDRGRADIWFSLGVAQKVVGRLEDAIRSFETAASLDNGMIEAVTERDELLAAAGMAGLVEGPVPVETELAPEESVPSMPVATEEMVEAPKEETVEVKETIVEQTIQTEVTVEAPEEISSEKPETSVPAIQEGSVPVPSDEPAPFIIEPSPEAAEVPVSFIVDGTSAIVPIETDVALLVKESPHNEIQNVETKTAVVPVEPSGLPAVLEEDRSIAVREDVPLPVPVGSETAVALQTPEVKALSPAETETKVSIPGPASISIVEPAPVVLSVPSETAPVIELPYEPEIPISDRELKAAVLLNLLGENDRALEEIDRYIRDRPASREARHVKANILEDLGRLPECLEELKEAVRLEPKDEIALMDIEAISRRLGRKEESMRILATITPSKEVIAREAVNLLDSKRYDEVISKCSNLGQLDSLVAKMALGTSLMTKAKYREAYKVLKQILLEHPTYPEALNGMGVCMRFMGEYGYEEPMHFMRLAVEADPNYGDAWNNIGATLFVLGDYEGAMESIRKAVAVDRRADYLINLSKCQIMVGDIAAAKLSLTSALQYEETAEIDFALGLIAEKEGDMKWALKLYEGAIELSPNFKDAIFNKQRVRLFLKYTQK
jgi:tetratricopeptide (TPR) repeat protein